MVSRIPQALALVAVYGAVACAAPDSGEANASLEPKMAALLDGLEGQQVAIIPFDAKNGACAQDPDTMDHATVAACAHLNADKTFEVTKDATRFSPRTAPDVILVVNGRPADASHPEVRWHAIVPLGPVAQSEGVTLTQSLRPQFVPLVAAELIGSEGVALLTAGAVAWLSGKAIVAKQGASDAERNDIANEDGLLVQQNVQLMTGADGTAAIRKTLENTLLQKSDKPDWAYAISAAGCTTVKSTATDRQGSPIIFYNPYIGELGIGQAEGTSSTYHYVIARAEQDALGKAQVTAGFGNATPTETDVLGPGFRRYPGGNVCKVQMTCWITFGPSFPDDDGVYPAPTRSPMKCTEYR
jgi:hypothetical protein